MLDESRDRVAFVADVEGTAGVGHDDLFNGHAHGGADGGMQVGDEYFIGSHFVSAVGCADHLPGFNAAPSNESAEGFCPMVAAHGFFFKVGVAAEFGGHHNDGGFE